MEGNVALRVVAALLAFGGAAVLGSAVARRLAKRSRSAAYSIGGEKNRAGWVSWLVRNGVGLMRPVARAVLRNARVRASVTNLLTAVEGIGFIATEESLLSLVLAAILIVGVGGFCAHCGSDMRRGPRLVRGRSVRNLREGLGGQTARAYARGRSRRAALNGGVLSVGAVASPDDAAGGGCYERSCWGTVPARSSPSRDGWQHTRGALGFPREELGPRARLRFRCARCSASNGGKHGARARRRAGDRRR